MPTINRTGAAGFGLLHFLFHPACYALLPEYGPIIMGKEDVLRAHQVLRAGRR
ncbi:hypothetical protein GIX45_13800 [Erwinia sp. CPCC 100877]|nr:hypothetical protein [Erwinia sp. CPCC 100877]